MPMNVQKKFIKYLTNLGGGTIDIAEFFQRNLFFKE